MLNLIAYAEFDCLCLFDAIEIQVCECYTERLTDQEKLKNIVLANQIKGVGVINGKNLMVAVVCLYQHA